MIYVAKPDVPMGSKKIFCTKSQNEGQRIHQLGSAPDWPRVGQIGYTTQLVGSMSFNPRFHAQYILILTDLQFSLKFTQNTVVLKYLQTDLTIFMV